MIFEVVHSLKLEQYDVEWVEINTSVGNFLIKPGHAPMVLTLAENQELLFKVKATSLVQKIIVVRGIVTVKRTSVVAILGASL